MALDYFAIASNGGFPEPTPTDIHRMVALATWGFLDGDGLDVTEAEAVMWVSEYLEDNFYLNSKVFSNKMMTRML